LDAHQAVPKRKKEQKYVLITGDGLKTGGTYTDNSDDLEVMNKDGTTKLCSAKSKYPLKILDTSGAVVSGKIISCGGGYPLTSDCYVYGEDNKWTKLANMAIPKNSMASVAFPNALWVTGGDNSNYDSVKTTELIYLDGTVKNGPELPEAMASHCIAQYEGKTFFVGKEKLWQVDNLDINNLDNIQWKVGPTYNLKRQYAGCGIVKSDQHGGRPLLVVAGGNGDSASKKTSEYLDFTLEGPTWKLLSRELPKRTYGYEEYLKYGPNMQPTMDGKGLLMTHYQDFYKWQCESAENCFWTYEESYQPKVPRKGGMFLTVPESLVQNC